MAMHDPTISIYIATRNRAHLLPRALSSILGQHPSIEVIVVDDSSDDSTPALLEAMSAETKLRWLRTDARIGACAARNMAIREARGHYVTGLDDDDEMVPGRLATLLAALRPEDAFVCASDWIAVPGRPFQQRVAPSRIALQTILARNVVGNQVLVQRDKLLACGGYDESLPAAQDHDLWIRLIHHHGPARGLREPLQIVHADTNSSRISTSRQRRSGYWIVYRKHRRLMDRNTRATHLYNLHKASQKTLGARNARAFFVAGNKLRVVSRIAQQTFPALSTLITSTGEAWLRARHAFTRADHADTHHE